MSRPGNEEQGVTNVAYYYHLALMGAWPAVFARGMAHLRGKRLELGVVGDLTAAAQATINRITRSHGVDFTIVARAVELERYEIPTLEAAQASNADVVFYCHSKGVSTPDPLRPVWAEYLFTGCLRHEAQALAGLAAGHNTAGVLWFTDAAQQFRGASKLVSYYAGNFWFARTDYLSSLPEIQSYFADIYARSRFCAELWIGRGDARPLLLDGTHAQSVAEVVATIVGSKHARASRVSSRGRFGNARKSGRL